MHTILRSSLVPIIFLICLTMPSKSSAEGSPVVSWRKEGHHNHLHKILFDASGTRLYTAAHDRLINVWNVSDGRLIYTINRIAPEEGDSGIISMTLTGDSSRLGASAFNFFKVFFLNENRQTRIDTDQGWIYSLSFSPEGNIIVSGGEDGTVKIYNGFNLQLVRSFQAHHDRVDALAFSPDNRYLATVGDENIAIWRRGDWKLMKRLTGHGDDVVSVAFSGNGQYLASGSADNTIKIWNTSNWSLKQTLHGHNYKIEALAFNPTSTRLASCDGPGNTIRLWRVEDGAMLKVFDGPRVEETRTIAYSPQGLFSWGGDQQLVNVGRLGVP